MTSTATLEPNADPVIDLDPDLDERFVSALSSLLWLLEIRQAAALLKSGDPDKATEALRDLWQSFNPAHREIATRVASRWGEMKNPGNTDAEALAAALVSLDDDQDWWIRVQLPSSVYQLTGRERVARFAVKQLWKEVCHV